jgi:hypothetical protein
MTNYKLVDSLGLLTCCREQDRQYAQKHSTVISVRTAKETQPIFITNVFGEINNVYSRNQTKLISTLYRQKNVIIEC